MLLALSALLIQAGRPRIRKRSLPLCRVGRHTVIREEGQHGSWRGRSRCALRNQEVKFRQSIWCPARECDI
jgi:hypothetical protein